MTARMFAAVALVAWGAAGAAAAPAADTAGSAVAPRAASVAWQVDAAASSLRFRATQAGAEFEGRFSSFRPQIAFSPVGAGAGAFDVEIAVASVATGDRERDETLRTADFFDAARHPVARYTATTFTRWPDGSFEARGRLVLRGVSREVPLRFTWTESAAGGGRSATLAGSAKLRRLEFGVGQGEWRDTTWVGDEVRVLVELRLRRGD